MANNIINPDPQEAKITDEEEGRWYKPKKFFWKYPLLKGVKVVAIIMILIMVICIILLIANAVIVMTRYDTTDLIVINALACVFTELAFSILMLTIHVLLYMSTKWTKEKRKKCVQISWVATQAVWLVHKASLLFILLLLLVKIIHLAAWVTIFLLGVFGMVLLFYFWSIVFSYASSHKKNMLPQNYTPKSIKNSKPPPTKKQNRSRGNSPKNDALTTPRKGATKSPGRSPKMTPRKPSPGPTTTP